MPLLNGVLNLQYVFCAEAHVLLWSCSLRLTLWVVILENESAFNLIGPVCASWGIPNRGTSKRDYICWRGAESLPYVAEANRMISRNLTCNHIMYCTYERISCVFQQDSKGHPGHTRHDSYAYSVGTGTSYLHIAYSPQPL